MGTLRTVFLWGGMNQMRGGGGGSEGESGNPDIIARRKGKKEDR